jgi:FO synthase
LTPRELLSLAEGPDVARLFEQASALRDRGHGHIITYSRKVFIPLTRLCRDVCEYCTFAHPPRKGVFPFLRPEEILEIAQKGKSSGCREALFTLGDKPELRYAAARQALTELGYKTTISYLTDMCRLVFERTGLLPHSNPGVLTFEELKELREVTVSQGLMLENVSPRLSEKGQPHFGSPDKNPKLRLETIENAGRQNIPFTTGILIGIGETWVERIESLIAIQKLHQQYDHIQEVIIQNFRAKVRTKMALAQEPDLDDLMRVIAIARIIFGPGMNIQAPPNLSPDDYQMLVNAGINDWGGISPVTTDHVNPEAPWPDLVMLSQKTSNSGKRLVERLAIYPKFALMPKKWLGSLLERAVTQSVDSAGLPRIDNWSPGLTVQIPQKESEDFAADPEVLTALDRIGSGTKPILDDIVSLFKARGTDIDRVTSAADNLRKQVSGHTVSYVVTRNINYTNICSYACNFCAFSKGRRSEDLGSKPYLLELEEIGHRALEAWDRGATEVCMQGGIHPRFTGDTYLRICDAVKSACPDIHIHAFSPLELSHGAKTQNISISEFINRLKAAGLGSVPGTAAEILDDEIRQQICPDKISSREWLDIVEAVHREGVRTTATIMFGHLETPKNWAKHLLLLRDLQTRTGGFTEFVPLPFVHMEAPIYARGNARRGPTFREAILMHAVSRLVLHPYFKNIQTSWVKMGREGAKECLKAGANDLGGTLMNESITRAAGTRHGQEFAPTDMVTLINDIGRTPRMRNTLYGETTEERQVQALRNLPSAHFSGVPDTTNFVVRSE